MAEERKIYSLRLYKNHDIDLLYLSYYPSISISKIIAEAMRSYIRGKDFIINVPDYKYDISRIKSRQIKIYFYTTKDADIIARLDSLPDFRISAVMKSVARQYLDKALIDYCPENAVEIQLNETKYKNKKNNFVKRDKQTENKPIQPEPVQPAITQPINNNTNNPPSKTETESTVQDDNFFLDMNSLIES